MILNQGKAAEVLIDGIDESIDMGIDKSSEQVLMTILSQGLYKDPIGSIVREWTSNGLDSHVEAGVQEPVIVTVRQDSSYNYWFSVQDFGVGISPDRVQNIISKYAASTKRNTNTMLGAFGLGLKSGLAYADSFVFETCYDKTKTSYIMYKGEEGTKIDKLSEEPTEEKNGSIFKIQIKNYSDRMEFITKCKQQLCYFEDVYFDVPTIDNSTITITKSEYWKHSTLANDSILHMSLDNVYYAIDYNKLGIDHPIPLKIALNFKIGEGLVPTPSREDIMYTPTAKQLILDRITKVFKFFAEKYNTEDYECANMEDFINRKNSTYYQFSSTLAIPLNLLEKYSKVTLNKLTVKGLVHNDPYILCDNYKSFADNYSVRGIVYNNRFNGKYSSNINIYNIKKEIPYILVKERPTGVQLDYLKHVFNGNVRFLYKNCEKKLGEKYGNSSYRAGDFKNTFDYIPLLGLLKYDKSEWRELIKEFQEHEKEWIADIPKIENYAPTKEWLDERKASRKKAVKSYVAKLEVNPKWGIYSNRADNSAKFETRGIMKISDLLKNQFLTVYGRADQAEDLAQLIGANGIYKTILPERDYKKIQEANIHNWITIEEFMTGKSKPFKRLATSLRISKLKDKYRYLFSYSIEDLLKKLSKDVSVKIHEIELYDSHNRFGYMSEEAREAILEIAQQNNLWDASIMATVEEIERIAPYFDFLKALGSYHTAEALRASVDILKYRKIKLNLEHYTNTPVLSVEEEEDALYAEEGDVEEDIPTEEELDENYV